MRAAPRKTLIFHIGDHKTGSTAIQQVFAQGQVTLHGHRLFYPAQLASNAIVDDCRTYGATDSGPARDEAAARIGQLARQVQGSDADFVLVSAERFERVPAALLHEVIETFFADAADEIRVIAYVRPHAARLMSSFAERMKIGVPKALKTPLARFAERRKKAGEFIYLPRFTAWRETFGDRFLLRPMVRTELYRGSVVDDFIHHAFGGLDYHIGGAGQVNKSLCLEDLMRLKVLHTHIRAEPDLRLRIGWEIARLVGQMPPPPTRTKLQLHKSLAEDIRDTYLEDARAMDRAFFDGAPLLETELHGAVDKALAKPQSTVPADHLSRSEMRSLNLMSRMIAGLLEAQKVDWPAFLHDKRLADIRAARDALQAAE